MRDTGHLHPLKPPREHGQDFRVRGVRVVESRGVDENYGMFLIRMLDLDGSDSLHVRAQPMVNESSIPIRRDVDELQRRSKYLGIVLDGRRVSQWIFRLPSYP